MEIPKRQQECDTMNASKPSRQQSSANLPNGFVVDGYQRALNGLEATIRPEIELKYAAEWNAAGMVLSSERL